MVFRVCFHSIEQILSHILIGMEIVCQHSCKQRKVLLHISRKLGCLPIIGNIYRMHQTRRRTHLRASFLHHSRICDKISKPLSAT